MLYWLTYLFKYSSEYSDISSDTDANLSDLLDNLEPDKHSTAVISDLLAILENGEPSDADVSDLFSKIKKQERSIHEEEARKLLKIKEEPVSKK